MKLPKTKKMLKRFGKAVVRAGRIRLAAAGMASSRLIKNFSYQLGTIVPGDLPKAITFKFGGSAKYWQFVDEGVRGSGGYKGRGRARGGKSPFRFKKKNIAKGVIDRWVVKKGLKAARDKSGRFIKRKGLAFVIGRAIAQRGLKRTQFFSAPYKKNMKYYIDKIANAYAEDLQDDIANRMKGKK
jgi:hypothetical protein